MSLTSHSFILYTCNEEGASRFERLVLFRGSMLRIIVPIKQVPNMSEVKFDTKKGVVDRSSAEAECNPFDLNALEAAVQLKEKVGGVVTAISMGPRRAEAVLRDALSRGADAAVLLTDKAFGGADTLATSYTLASAIRQLGQFDLIICGEKTVDGDTGQVGPEIAEHLGLPHVAYVSKLEEKGEKLVVLCDIENEHYLIECSFPVLITVTKDVNTPRLPTFRDKMRARSANVEMWGAEELLPISDKRRWGVRGSPTRVRNIMIPTEQYRKGRIFRDTDDEAVEETMAALREWLKG